MNYLKVENVRQIQRDYNTDPPMPSKQTDTGSSSIGLTDTSDKLEAMLDDIDKSTTKELQDLDLGDNSDPDDNPDDDPVD